MSDDVDGLLQKLGDCLTLLPDGWAGDMFDLSNGRPVRLAVAHLADSLPQIIATIESQRAEIEYWKVEATKARFPC